VLSLAYYSRSASAAMLVGPVLAFFFFGQTVSDLLTRLTEVLLMSGAMRPDWVTHNMFQIAVTAMVALLVVFGFREQPLRDGAAGPGLGACSRGSHVRVGGQSTICR
jgi:hypothetical protein